MKRQHAVKENVLLVNITRLGDMLQATPTISGIKQENPNARITVLVEKQFEKICHWLPDIDEVLAVDLGMTVRCLARGNEGTIEAFDITNDLIEDLKSRNFDYCLNMSSSAYTALLLRMVGVKRHGGWTSDEQGYRVIESDWAKLFASSVFHQNRQFNSINLVDVFRCSADVEQHPYKLQVTIDPAAAEEMEQLISEAPFTNDGPLVCIQAGASQLKRQWSPKNFITLIQMLTANSNARVVLTGTKKELAIIEPIVAGVNSDNVFVAAGKTNIPQLAALLNMADILITGDTGPMHISAAAGTPVISMFLASAYGFETGPYGEDHIVLQPVISCGPCNPNKNCSRPDCHDQITPELVAALTAWRLEGMNGEVPVADPNKVVIYKSFFDEFGFCDLEVLNGTSLDWRAPFRRAYRKLWLNDIAGYPVEAKKQETSILQVDQSIEGLMGVMQQAEKGEVLIEQLIQLVKDTDSPVEELRRVNQAIGELDREIEESGYHYAHLGPITRMFLFAKENISGTEALDLASQMKGHYQRLKERCEKFNAYYLN